MPSQSRVSESNGPITHNVPILSMSLETAPGSRELKRENGDIGKHGVSIESDISRRRYYQLYNCLSYGIPHHCLQ
ncbi:hypothetical protein N7535_006662 [Penicillium sp. DV-2018c]|nr:hypothetical protein N7461_007255 [Penicillium sp. DV-2018c]KAJ5567356.1 hypothetical protein N7535_006662 [Penicillium sp. DV-2018c]